MMNFLKDLWKKQLTFFVIQLIATIVFLILIIRTKILPIFYFIILLAVLGILLVLAYVLMKYDEDQRSMLHSLRRMIGKTMSVLLSICLILASIYVAVFSGLLKKTMGQNREEITFSLVVLANASYDSAASLKGKTIAYNPNLNDEFLPEVFENLKKNCPKYKTKYVYNYTSLTNALYNIETESILINEAFRNTIDDSFPKFDRETKVVWSYTVVVDHEEGKDMTQLSFRTDGMSVLISGIDSRGSVYNTSRSDINMVVTYNPGTHVLLITNIPRDYYVELADSKKKDKLTHAGMTGTPNTLNTINNLLDTDIDYYVRVNFQALVKLVNALGGIDIFSDTDLTSHMKGMKPIKQGWNHINGKQALFYCRQRYAYKSGDVHRAANQQEVMRAIIQKLSTPKILTNYVKIMNAISNTFITNLPTDAISELANMQLSSGESWHILTSILSGEGKMMKAGYYMPNTKLYYMIPDEESIEKNKQYIRNVLDGVAFSIDS